MTNNTKEPVTRSTKHRYRSDMTDTELDEYVAETERLLDNLDPAVIATADRLEDLRAIRAVIDQQADLERQLPDLVEQARANGRSWSDIALVLGVTKQSAHTKYRAAPD